MTHVLVLGAGGPAGVNTVRALEAAGHHVVAADSNPEHLHWLPPRRELAPDHRDPGWLDWLNRLIDTCWIQVVVPQPDPVTLHVAQVRDRIHAETVLPATGTILTCQDKFETGWRWANVGLRKPIVRLDSIDACVEAGERFGWPLWIRATRGAGAQCASVAANGYMLANWLAYWGERNEGYEFVAEEFLPGRDYCWTGVYNHGQLVTSFLRERLEYIYPNLTPSGRTGTPAVSRVVHDDQVCDVAEFAVETIDRDWHGVACVDLREDSEGVARPTEINAGRVATTTGLYYEQGLNVPDVLLGLAGMAGQVFDGPIRHAIPAGITLRRHIDIGHVWTRAEMCGECEPNDTLCPPCYRTSRRSAFAAGGIVKRSSWQGMVAKDCVLPLGSL